MPSLTALLYKALFAGIIATYDTALGILDEVQNLFLFGAVRETLLDTGAGIRNIVTLEIECIVDILDVTDGVAVETLPNFLLQIPE